MGTVSFRLISFCIWQSNKDCPRMKQSGQQYDDRIIEVAWNKDLEQWRFMRFRDDKPNANFKSIVESVIESIADGVEKETVSVLTGSTWGSRDLPSRTISSLRAHPISGQLGNLGQDNPLRHHRAHLDPPLPVPLLLSSPNPSTFHCDMDRSPPLPTAKSADRLSLRASTDSASLSLPMTSSMTLTNEWAHQSNEKYARWTWMFVKTHILRLPLA